MEFSSKRHLKYPMAAIGTTGGKENGKLELLVKDQFKISYQKYW